jgi:hypothetical protein
MRQLRLNSVFLGSMAVSGCQGAAIWGNLAVFAVSVGIFCSTLALGRAR